jgi:transcriptional regulator with XRE-family HTH domain
MLVTVDRAQLADFLRRRRAAMAPGDAGLPTGRRRRTPGLRREEVAALADMSVDYYARLEQGRGPHPSVEILGALGRALRLSVDERDHLYHLGGQAPPTANGPSHHVRPGLLRLLDRLADTPAMIASDLDETLVQNRLSMALIGDHTGHVGRDRSFTWRWFATPAIRRRFPAEDHEQLGRTRVADLRATAARRRGADVIELVDALLAVSPEFVRLWDEHDVAVRRTETKRIIHPAVGLIEIDCEVLHTPEHDQRLVVYTAAPGSEAEAQLDLLRVIGLEQFDPATS